jgi:type I restriction-modification system DNA methylase subunit
MSNNTNTEQSIKQKTVKSKPVISSNDISEDTSVKTKKSVKSKPVISSDDISDDTSVKTKKTVKSKPVLSSDEQLEDTSVKTKKSVKSKQVISSDEQLEDKSVKTKQSVKSKSVILSDDISDDTSVKTKKSVKSKPIISSDEQLEDTSVKTKKKVKSKSVILSDEQTDDKTDNTYIRLPDNEIIYQLTDEDNNENKIISVLKMIEKAHNILYQSENIVGHKALQIIMNLLFIKLIQPYLSDKEENGKIDLLNKKYYCERYDDDVLDNILKYFTKLSILTKQPLKDIRNDTQVDAIKQMGEILKRHPITKMIYTEANFIKVKEATTIQTLINDVIDKINFKDFDDNEDVIGEIYEFILNKYVKNDSKELGQFFTPRSLMKLILKYKKDRISEIFSSKDNISVYDSCMGTGGWLVSVYNMFKNKNINIAAGEVEPETFQYGLMNLILTMKKFPNDVFCNSSLTHVNNNKHTLITTNPPFNSKKQIKFSQIKNNFENDKYTSDNKINIKDVYKLEKDDPPIQFLELDTYKLEENGMCIIVLPYGEFFSGNTFSKTREHFMKEINITDIILFPGGIFTHTDIKTCVLIYEKTKGTKDIMISKVNKDCNIITKITNININDIKKEPLLSWNYIDYLIDEFVNELKIKMNNFDWVEFGKIFTLEKGKIQSSKVEEDENGEYNIISISEKNKTTNNIDNNNLIDGENIFIATTSSGTSSGPFETKIKYYNGKCSYTNLLSRLKINNDYINKIKIKYIYYYLKSIKKHIEESYEKGACNKILDQKNFNRMMIPIPPLEIQNRISTKIDSSNDKVKYMRLIVESMKQDVINFFEMTIDIENRKKETEWIPFGKVFTLEKGKLQSSKVEEDENGDGDTYFITKEEKSNRKIKSEVYYNDGLFIANAFNGNGKCPIIYSSNKCIHSDLMLKLNTNDKYKSRINIKYIYHYLKMLKTHIEETYSKGACNQSLDVKNFNRMEIQIPSIEQQNKCIKSMNEMEDIITRWEKDIDDILNNGCNKFLDFLEGESIRYNQGEENIIKKAFGNLII